MDFTETEEKKKRKRTTTSKRAKKEQPEEEEEFYDYDFGDDFTGGEKDTNGKDESVDKGKEKEKENDINLDSEEDEQIVNKSKRTKKPIVLDTDDDFLD